jgi:hypothetical protein
MDIVDGAFVLRLARFERTFVRLERNEKSNYLAPRAYVDISKTNLDVFCQSVQVVSVSLRALNEKGVIAGARQKQAFKKNLSCQLACNSPRAYKFPRNT